MLFMLRSVYLRSRKSELGMTSHPSCPHSSYNREPGVSNMRPGGPGAAHQLIQSGPEGNFMKWIGRLAWIHLSG